MEYNGKIKKRDVSSAKVEERDGMENMVRRIQERKKR